MISAKRVHEILTVSFAETETNPNLVRVEGVIRNVGLDSKLLATYRDEVIGMLQQLNSNFMCVDGGGGWSFLQMPFDKDEKHWGEHQNVDELYMIANGLGLTEFLLPREVWKALPGGMPYIVVNNNLF